MSKILQKRCVFERLSVKNGHHAKNNLSHIQILLVFGHQTKKKLPMSKIAMISNFRNVNINRRRLLLIFISSLEASQYFLSLYFNIQREIATEGNFRTYRVHGWLVKSGVYLYITKKKRLQKSLLANIRRKKNQQESSSVSIHFIQNQIIS